MSSKLILAAVLGLTAAACGDEVSLAVDVELAPSPEPGERCDVERAELPEASCLRIQACRERAGTCESLFVSNESGPHGEETSIVVPVDATRRFAFDVKGGGDAVRVRMDLADRNGTILASGEALATRGAPPQLRLHRYGAPSCAGGLIDSGIEVVQPAPRAFHESVALPNGDVLVFGGVRGNDIRATGLMQGAPLQREVEVYLAREHHFAKVEGDFGRVLFVASLLDDDDDGRYRVRVTGGFEAEGDNVALRFDATQAFSRHGAPVMPGADATATGGVDLLYDPDTRTLEIVPQMSSIGGFNAASDLGEERHPQAVLLGLANAGASRVPNPMFAGVVLWLDREGVSRGDVDLRAGRFGASVTRLAPDRDVALLWGGDVNENSRDSARALAGEIVTLDEATTLAISGGEDTALPEPVVFHTATAVSDGETEGDVLIAGGLEVGCFGVSQCPGQGVSTTFAADPFQLLHFADPGEPSADRLDAMGFLSTVFHTATPIPFAGGGIGALLVGGAYRSGDEAGLRATGQVVLVSPRGDRFVVSAFYDGVESLLRPRFGHAVARLPEGLLLVTGGLEVSDAGSQPTFSAISEAELIPLTPRPDERISCDGEE